MFVALAGGIIFIKIRSSRHNDTLSRLELKHVASLRFFQDHLRDPRDLDLRVAENKDIEGFVAAIRTLRPSDWALKSLTRQMRISMRLELLNGTKTLYSVDIFRTEQTGNAGIIKISQEGSVFTTPGGLYESADLLQWAEAMQGRFKDIAIFY